VEVWPENWPAFRIFADLQTQWYVGMAGPTGLNHLVMFATLDREAEREGWTDEEIAQLEDDLRLMEREVLVALSERS